MERTKLGTHKAIINCGWQQCSLGWMMSHLASVRRAGLVEREGELVAASINYGGVRTNCCTARMACVTCADMC
jgi:hypothetical protein